MEPPRGCTRGFIPITHKGLQTVWNPFGVFGIEPRVEPGNSRRSAPALVGGTRGAAAPPTHGGARTRCAAAAPPHRGPLLETPAPPAPSLFCQASLRCHTFPVPRYY